MDIFDVLKKTNNSDMRSTTSKPLAACTDATARNARKSTEILEVLLQPSTNFDFHCEQNLNLDLVIALLNGKANKTTDDIPLMMNEEMDISDVDDPRSVDMKHKSNSLTTSYNDNLLAQDEYYKSILKILKEQLNTQELVDMLTESLTNVYSLMIVDPLAYGRFIDFKKDKKVNWITNGNLNTSSLKSVLSVFKSTLTDHVILLATSTILLADNAMLLLQILAEHIEGILKAFCEGLLSFTLAADENFAECTEQTVIYFFKGYSNFSDASARVSPYFYALDNIFLSKFSLSWNMLCQRLFFKHVYSNEIATIMEYISKLQEFGEFSGTHYFIVKNLASKLHREMNAVNNDYPKIWVAINKYFTSDSHLERQNHISKMYDILCFVYNNGLFNVDKNTELTDAIKRCRQKWANGFLEKPNNLTYNDQCENCNDMLDNHSENCECITCSIGGSTQRNSKNSGKFCCRCDINSDVKTEETATQTLYSKGCLDNFEKCHIAWAVFHNLKDRQKYNHTEISADNFCRNCSKVSCVLARKIINSRYTTYLAKFLTNCFQPIFVEEKYLNAIFKFFIEFDNAITLSSKDNLKSCRNNIIQHTCWIFLISLYIMYIKQSDNKIEANFKIDCFELCQNDIRTCFHKLIGDEIDTDFLEFCQRFDMHISRKSHANVREDSNSYPKTCNTILDAPTKNNSNICGDAQPEKTCNFNKKHVKTESNRERMMLTRERLRKKLSKKTVSPQQETLQTDFNMKSNNMSKSTNVTKISTEKMHKFNNQDYTIPTNIESTETSTSYFSVSENTTTITKEIKKNIKQNKCKAEENLNKWVTERLKFIEGCSIGVQSANPKKAAKKAKQKQRQEEKKLTHELSDLKSQFHDIYFKEFKSKESLKESVSNKKQRDKKQTNLEINIKKLQRIKADIEKHILELIATVKQTNSAFKFAYLPTKEEQQVFRENLKKIQLSSSESNIESKSQFNAESTNFKVVQTTHQTKGEDPTCNKTTLKKENVIMSALTPEPKLNPTVFKINNIPNYLNTAKARTSKNDDSKRIVTIRRINLPNALEPQVTVTAKSNSPNEEDKLLYTFVNGQLVQSNLLQDSSLLLKIASNDQIIQNYKTVSAQLPTANMTQTSKVKYDQSALENNQSLDFFKQKFSTITHCTEKQTKPKKACKTTKKTASLESQLNVVKSNGQTNSKKAAGTKKVSYDAEMKEPKPIKIHQRNLRNNSTDKRSSEITLLDKNRVDRNNHFCNLDKTLEKIRMQYNTADPKTLKKIKNRKKSLNGNGEKLSQAVDVEYYDSNLLRKTQKSQMFDAATNNRVKCNRKLPNTSGTNNTKSSKKDLNKSHVVVNLPQQNEFANANKIKTKANTPDLQSLSRQMEELNLQQVQQINRNDCLSNHLNNVSIMDQLNSGVQVENLLLPPGITLTKIDAAKSEQLRQKADSISRLSQPLQDVQTTMNSPYSHMNLAHDKESFVLDSNIRVFDSNTVIGSIPSNKAKKKRKKTKTKENTVEVQIGNKSCCNSDNRKSKTITLRNPIFSQRPSDNQLLPNQDDHMYKLRFPVPMQIDQPAAIIKNKNGMFTIRNLALHQAVTKGLTQEGLHSHGSGNVNYLNAEQAVATNLSLASFKQKDSSLSKTIPLNLHACNTSDDRHRSTQSYHEHANNNTNRNIHKPEESSLSGISDKHCSNLSNNPPSYQFSNLSLGLPSSSQNMYKADVYQKYCFHVNSGIEKDLSSLGTLSNSNENWNRSDCTAQKVNTGLVCFDNASILKNLITGQQSKKCEGPIIQVCDQYALRPNFQNKQLNENMQSAENNINVIKDHKSEKVLK